jgi:predicted PurR-regulated permease PerM
LETVRADTPSFARKSLIAVGVGVLVLGVIALVLHTFDVLLVIFAGILNGIFLARVSRFVSRLLHLPRGLSLALVIVLLVVATVAGVILLAPSLGTQLGQLTEQLPRAAQEFQRYLEKYGWGRELISQLSQGKAQSGGREIVSGVLGFFSTTLGALVNLAIIVFVGIYAAAETRVYMDGAVALFPRFKRERARQVIKEIHDTLSWWLVGRASAMVSVGLMTWLGLWILGVPLALALGLLAMVLTFVPYIGAVVSAVPAVLLGLLQGPAVALYIVILYIGVHVMEGYLLTPLIQRRAVHLPPVLTIAAQVLLGFLAGIMGLVVATPLMAAGMVLIKRFYVEDVLEQAELKP